MFVSGDTLGVARHRGAVYLIGMIGPYNTPMALGREPMMAIFLVLLAPTLLQVVIGGVAFAFFPQVFSNEGVIDRGLVTNVTLLMCFVVAAHFAIMTFWSDWIGAGPFGGAMQTKPRWIMTALWIGPFILIAPTVIIGLFMGGGDENWAYADDFNPAWTAVENQGLATLFYAIILAPVVEEVTFRGIGMGAMIARGIGGVTAAIVTTAAFTIIHGQYSPAALAVIFIAGLGFAALRLISGTLIVPIVAHISANSVVTLLGS